ncbi:MAG: HAD-IA family hydrolase [Halofilum sp. (in: g-proteobacteria)]|nr:HAD-IA family hydrolase [Halofilum sp. (in: g-proteobacteria)]
MKTMPRAISFDLDDTLWACDDVIGRAEEAVYGWLQRYCPRITAEYDLEAMRQVRMETAAVRPDLQADLTRLRHETLAWHARRAGYDVALADAAVEVFLDERHRVELYPDVHPVLERLAGRFRLIALTNGNADVHRAGIGDWFEVALSAADVGAPKPDPAMFEHACGTLGIRPGELLHVGDDPLRDVHAARRFGARAFWVNREGREWPADLRRAHHEAETLSGLPDLFRR